MDASPLSRLNATLSRVPGGGGFQVADADRGELLYEFGLRSGDVITSLNAYKLDSATAVAVAFSQLWSGGATSFNLELQRDGSTVELAYTYADR